MKTEVLCKYGVYKFLGCEIPNYKELGLQEDKVYQVKKMASLSKKCMEALLVKKFQCI